MNGPIQSQAGYTGGAIIDNWMVRQQLEQKLIQKKNYHKHEANNFKRDNNKNERKLHSAHSQPISVHTHQPKYNNYNFFNEKPEIENTKEHVSQDTDNNTISVNAYVKSNKQNLKNFVSNLKTGDTEQGLSQQFQLNFNSTQKTQAQRPITACNYTTQDVNKNHVEDKKLQRQHRKDNIQINDPPLKQNLSQQKQSKADSKSIHTDNVYNADEIKPIRKS